MQGVGGLFDGFLGGSEGCVATTGAVIVLGSRGANERKNTKNESASDVIRVYQNWLEFETSMRRDMVDTKLKILFTPGIYVGIVTILRT